MKTIILNISVLMLTLPAFSMCSTELSDDKTYRPPVEEIDPPQPGLWASFESKFERYVQGQKHAGQSDQKAIVTEWADTVWRRDRTHTQIVVWSNDSEFDNIAYIVENLEGEAGTIDKSNIRLRFGKYVIGHTVPGSCATVDDTPVNVADALSDEPVTTVSSSDDPVKIWLTVDIPENTSPGVYKGDFTVTSGDTERTLSMTLTVADRILPPVSEWNFHLDLWQFPYGLMNLVSPAVEFASDEYFALMEPFYRKLADAGQKAVTTYIKGSSFYVQDSMVKWIRKASGQWEFDYSDFDAYVEKMSSWGIDGQISCFSLLGWNPQIPYYDEAAGADTIFEVYNSEMEKEENGGSATACVVGDDEWCRIWMGFLDAFENHLQIKGWFDKTVLFFDESNAASMQTVIDFIRGHNQNWKIGLAGSSLDAEMESKVYDYSIFLTRQSQKSTPVHTFYTSCSHIHPNNLTTPENSPAEMTWMGWHAAGNGYNGYLNWGYDNWRASEPFDSRDCSVSGDGTMLYYLNKTSDANGVVSSMRFELLREGIQDYEKILILNDPDVNAAAASFVAPAAPESNVDAEGLVIRGQRAVAVASMK